MRDVDQSIRRLFHSALVAIVLRLLNCARRMMRSATFKDELMRAKSAAVYCRNAVRLESLFTTQLRVCAVLSGIPCGVFHRPRVAAPVGAAHVEFWRRFSEGRYQCFSCNERNDRGSISWLSSFVSKSRGRFFLMITARCISGSRNARGFGRLDGSPFLEGGRL